MEKFIVRASIVALFVFSCHIYYSHMRLKDLYADMALTMSVSAQSAAVSDEKFANDEKPEAQVTFYICGEVLKPDVYSLPKGSRISDAIEAAGGKTVSASLELMESVAAEISDGQKIYVPKTDDDIDKINYMNNNSNINEKSSLQAAKNPDVIVNINTAGIEELCQIPGVGEQTAKSIYEYRRENGDFILIDDIKNVRGIGEKTFESIKKNITAE